MGKHAKLSASASARWMACPASVKASAPYPDQSSVYAEEGTIAHALAEQMIRQKVGKEVTDSTVLDRAEEFYSHHTSMGFADEMRSYIDTYSDYVAEQVTTDSIILLEQELDLTNYIPDGFGTTDVMILTETHLDVIDLKYGKGVLVDAKDNPQLSIYGLGALEVAEMLAERIDDVTLTIYQPRRDHVSTWVLPRDVLVGWGQNVLRPAAAYAYTEPDIRAAYHSGDWCQFCKAKKDCKARKTTFAMFEQYACSDEEQSTAETEFILSHSADVRRLIDETKEKAVEDLQNGIDYPHYKLGHSRTISKWSDDAEKMAEEKNVPLFETVMISPARAKKALSEDDYKYMKQYIIKPQGKPCVVKKG